MPPPTLDYRRPLRDQRPLPWYKTDLAPAAVAAAIILVVNGWLVWSADTGWGFWVWVFVLIPLANAILAGALLACSPVVRWISGMSTSLHVRVTLFGCAIAVAADAAIVFARLHGC